MGKEMFCDLCRATVAIEEALKKVSIGENVIAEVCLTCGSQLEQGLKSKMAENTAAIMLAKKTAQAQVQSAPPAPDQSTQQAPKPADKSAGAGGA